MWALSLLLSLILKLFNRDHNLFCNRIKRVKSLLHWKKSLLMKSLRPRELRHWQKKNKKKWKCRPDYRKVCLCHFQMDMLHQTTNFHSNHCWSSNGNLVLLIIYYCTTGNTVIYICHKKLLINMCSINRNYIYMKKMLEL